ncbi:MAG: acetyl-CoA hydrolase/transferase family protein [Dehalococcoidia bacterium]|nr:acetyl-CoA hydrolase/transferase family protein [Dehalococcoidia bacterium]
MQSWREEYAGKLVSADQAVAKIGPNQRIVIPITGEPPAVLTALAKHTADFKNVQLLMGVPRQEWEFFRSGVGGHIAVGFENFVGAGGRAVVEERLVDYYPTLFSFHSKINEERKGEAPPIDVTTFVVSPPDDEGYCYFGTSVWYKPVIARCAKVIIAEVQSNVIPTRGGGRLHVSEIDWFVENEVPFVSRGVPDADDVSIKIATSIHGLIRDGDTLQLGTGRAALSMPLDILLKGKNDLGWHSEITPGPIVKRIKAKQINSSRKTLNRGIAVTTLVQNHDKEDLEFVRDNPAFEVRDSTYVNNVVTIATHDNMVAMNSGLAIDLTGQIASETIGGAIFNGMGGQQEFVFGAMLSKGGRSVHVLPSTAGDGFISRIVPRLPEGEYVTIPRSWADHVVTEWGVAKLLGKSHRQRAEALIEVAHPAFREELKAAARKMHWP